MLLTFFGNKMIIEISWDIFSILKLVYVFSCIFNVDIHIGKKKRLENIESFLIVVGEWSESLKLKIL